MAGAVQERGFTCGLTKSDESTAQYVPPETLVGSKCSPELADVWAMGVILFFWTQGCMPFQGSTAQVVLRAHRGTVTFHHELSPDLMDLIKKMLAVNPAERLSVDEILAHPWLQNATAAIGDVPLDEPATIEWVDRAPHPGASDMAVKSSQTGAAVAIRFDSSDDY